RRLLCDRRLLYDRRLFCFRSTDWRIVLHQDFSLQDFCFVRFAILQLRERWPETFIRSASEGKQLASGCGGLFASSRRDLLSLWGSLAPYPS
ncbi:MAG: hypothetical protein CMN03_03790, partial [Roseibacillus sp.]|nr:hypothetical protein [Roseibacillus sp.]